MVIQHRGTKGLLHSHPDKYPLKYPDGRISSQGQQVTCYPHNDTNNHWLIVPAYGPSDDGIVRHNDIVQLLHVNTKSLLLTHDVASPSMPTNQEFTTQPDDERHNETLFQIRIDDGQEGDPVKTKSSHFQLYHMDTGVVMWTHTSPALPDWGFKQQEVNGHKNLQDKTSFWVFKDIIEEGASFLRPLRGR